MTGADAIAARLYEGILEPAQWVGALQSIQATLQCAAFHQLDIQRADLSVQSVAVSMNGDAPPSEQVLEYERHYTPQDIRMPSIWQASEAACGGTTNT